jgi:hypothetical protein
MNGMRPSATPDKFKVPGYPQDMMDMHGMMPPDQVRKVQAPLTRGMRSNWPMAVMAMMTVLRVLPDELYDKVISGNGEIKPGASVPGGGSGEEMGHGGHNMEGMKGMDDMKDSDTKGMKHEDMKGTNQDDMKDMKQMKHDDMKNMKGMKHEDMKGMKHD